MGEGNWNESDLWQREAEENGLQMEPELQNAVQSPKQIRKNCRREVRRVCNVLGWALAFFQRDDGTCQHTSGSGWQRMRADGGVISTFLNRMVNAAWYEDGGSTLVIYALVLPFVFLILRLVPEERAEKMKISFLQFCMFLFWHRDLELSLTCWEMQSMMRWRQVAAAMHPR